jgi:hypothetical protein
MKKFRKKKPLYNIITFIGLAIIIFTISFGCDINKFSAGSYPYAETFLISSPEQNFIKAVNIFKAQHPETVVPIRDLLDGREDSSDHWFHIYFYLPKENRIIYCWTRPENMNETTFAIVGINEGLKLGNWKEINKDFSTLENKKVLKNFEEMLLNPIKKIIQEENGL